ncbi:MAG: C-terminal binding protein [Bacteroidota bacterium]
MKQIAVIDTGYESYAYEHQLFAYLGYELIIYEGEEKGGRRPFEFAGSAEGILVRDRKVGPAEMALMPKLKAIVRYGVGYDNIDLEAARERSIRVSNVQGYASHSVSDHALALMFACTRNLQGKREGSFGVPPRKEIMELHNKTLGIIGIGRIGSQLALKASSLFKRIVAFDPYKSLEYMTRLNVSRVALPELLRESHVISLHCSLSDETRHILDDSGFEMMAQKPVVINTSRGPVIAEKALLDALREGKIHSAGLDVFEQEPPGKGQAELLGHPLVVTTPHVAWYSENAVKTLQKRAADNMAGLLLGKQVDDEL